MTKGFSNYTLCQKNLIIWQDFVIKILKLNRSDRKTDRQRQRDPDRHTLTDRQTLTDKQT